MTTYNITDSAFAGGAKGNGKEVTATLSITSGTKILTSSTPLWSATPGVEDGKKIFIAGAGDSGSIGGGFVGDPTDILITTIDHANSTTQIVLVDNATHTLSASSRLVAWGTDDAPAFVAFVGAHQGEFGAVLQIPAASGFYPIWDSNGIPITTGIKQITVTGDISKPELKSNACGIRIGSFGIGTKVTFQGVNWEGNLGTPNGQQARALVQNTVPGTSVTCITHADASKYATDDWICLMAVETQSGGEPMNPAFFEYHKVASSDSGTGIVTFTDSILHPERYKTHYPYIDNPFPDGPGFIYRMGATSLNDWDCENTIENLTLTQSVHQINISGRSLVFTNCVFNSTPNITACKSCSMSNCVWTESSEIDKCNQLLTFTDNDMHRLVIQSSGSAQNLIIDNTHIEIMGGSAENTTIVNGSIIDNFTPGSTGAHRELIVSDSHIELWGSNQLSVTTGSAVSGLATIVDGVITTNGTNSGVWFPLYAPGNHCMFGSTGSNADFYGPGFTITDIAGPNPTSSGVPFTITTTHTGGIPAVPVGSAAIVLNALPSCTFTNVTSSPTSYRAADLNNAPPNTVYRSYLKRYYGKNGVKAPSALADPLVVPGGLVNQYDNQFTIIGKINSIVVNVITPHTGLGGALYFAPFSPGDNEPFNTIDGDTVTWAPHFNLRVLGKRTITPAGAFNDQGVNSGIGGLSGDSSPLTMPEPYLWIYNASNPFISADVSGESTSLDFTWEIITDQGFSITSDSSTLPVFPLSLGLRLRLHA